MKNKVDEKPEAPQIEENPQITQAGDGVDNAVDNALEHAPEVSESAVAAHTAETAKAAETAHKTDSAGVVFNPDLHATEADGTTPKLTVAGRFAKKRGRKTGGNNKPSGESYIKKPGASSVSPTRPGEMTEADLMKARATGVGAANMLFAAGVALGGDEWHPRQKTIKAGDQTFTIDERANLENAFADYCVATGKSDLPPGWALVFAVAAYAAPRFVMPQTQSRTKAFAARVVAWWHSRKVKKIKGKTDGAQSSPRNDGKRENDTSEKDSAKVTK